MHIHIYSNVMYVPVTLTSIYEGTHELCKGSRLGGVAKSENIITVYHQFRNKLMIHPLCHKSLSEYF